MPFGKHAGETIEELPSTYLRWMFENLDDAELVEAAETEYDWRESWGKHIR
jgi:hypothetical protein